MCLTKHIREYLRQTYNAVFNPNTWIRKTSVVQLRLIILLLFLSHLHLHGQTAPCNTKRPLQQATPGTGALQASSSNIFLSDRPVLGPTNPWQTRSQVSNGFCWVNCLGTTCREWVAGGRPYECPDLVNSCRIQFSHSLQFCFQLKLDQNQVICQQTVNHCLATFAGMRFHQQPCSSCAFLHEAAR